MFFTRLMSKKRSIILLWRFNKVIITVCMCTVCMCTVCMWYLWLSIWYVQASTVWDSSQMKLLLHLTFSPFISSIWSPPLIPAWEAAPPTKKKVIGQWEDYNQNPLGIFWLSHMYPPPWLAWNKFCYRIRAMGQPRFTHKNCVKWANFEVISVTINQFSLLASHFHNLSK